MFLDIHMLAVTTTMVWLRRLGGPGLILLGIVDNSLLPLPGSMDVLTIWLSARQRELWPYYAAMATLGALIGGYITYALAKKGGKQALERKFSRSKVEKLYQRFERWGFWTVTVPALLPPPFPMVPFLIAAGTLQYSRKQFLGSLALGRGIRFFVFALLGHAYGRAIASFFSKYYKPALFTLSGLAILGGILAFAEYMRMRKKPRQTSAASPRKAA
jgi:membrane protein YqaA with SNARE-associated domain